jgi:osmotically-inducible protein OsmY
MKNDLELQKEVMAQLDRETSVVPGSIGVEVHHGVVKLAGRVSSEEVRKNSAVAARRVDGVTNVLLDLDLAGAHAAI